MRYNGLKSQKHAKTICFFAKNNKLKLNNNNKYKKHSKKSKRPKKMLFGRFFACGRSFAAASAKTCGRSRLDFPGAV